MLNEASHTFFYLWGTTVSKELLVAMEPWQWIIGTVILGELHLVCGGVEDGTNLTSYRE
jgi:hypothetical protein